MKKLLVFIFCLSISFGCSRDDINPEAVNVRLSNISTYDFKNIIVNTSTGEVEFNDLDAQTTSEYKVFEKAYRYAFVELEIEGNTYTIQPIDYVGETPLSKGKYTYQINASELNGQYGTLSLSLKED
ncbi:hypothetical protein [Echinicola shivajiensis]|uniref:hypothetical protein n=1 Tax=Echinicola shivajiensis TaxID=1035916 RepID=UPI001BFCD5BC|nr:hypothetical protein [Echinicola shivajiensis]